MSKLFLRTEGDTVVVVTRRFAAPPAEVFRAHTDPALVQQWCLGPDGWTMPVCICDARPVGKMRYEWTNGDGAGFHLLFRLTNLPKLQKLCRLCYVLKKRK